MSCVSKAATYTRDRHRLLVHLICVAKAVFSRWSAAPVNFRRSSHIILSTPSYRLQPSSSHFQLKVSRFGLVKNRLVVHYSSGSDEFGSANWLPFTPNKLFMQEAIGAEYGEGFETFRADGALKVDVDYLNDRLQEGFLQRERYAMKPHEAYGLIFSWDNVVADTRAQRWKAWKAEATCMRRGYVKNLDCGSLKGWSWSTGKVIREDSDEQRLLLYADADHVLNKLENPVYGLADWLEAVYTAHIPCAVVSNLDRKNMVEALERMGLDNYFQAIVTEEDGMESMAQRFLSAALKLDRKPSKCVVFEDDRRGVTAAHNCTMMAVALIGTHPAYDLGQADLALASFSELSVINLRRLFADKGSTFMDLQKQIIEKTPSKRKLTTDTLF